jgi:hypothetical protein
MRLKNMLIIMPVSRKNKDGPITSPLPRRERMEERGGMLNRIMSIHINSGIRVRAPIILVLLGILPVEEEKT